ncbi:hypothetical protein NC651_008842 [Populus alba x Populus x berolinensis]|nr:hypothetical protein NC651_008842 [Populus alba x Populus x berolinensis]
MPISSLAKHEASARTPAPAVRFSNDTERLQHINSIRKALAGAQIKRVISKMMNDVGDTVVVLQSLRGLCMEVKGLDTWEDVGFLGRTAKMKNCHSFFFFFFQFAFLFFFFFLMIVSFCLSSND